MALGFWNGWLLCLPMVLVGAIAMASHKQLARRLSDMTDYTPREKLATVAASLLPYLLMGVAAFTPLAPTTALLVSGLVIASVGTVAFAFTLSVFAKAPVGETLQSGPYRLSRNPLYVSAGLVFVGVCVATASLLLSALLALMLVLQHFMVLAEERSCARRYGSQYLDYLGRTPRYLGFR